MSQAVGPTSISYLCWWPGVEGKFSIEYCIQLSGSLGSCILCGYSFLHLAMRPSLLLPSCFWHSSDPSRVQSAVAPTCTPATKKQLWSGTTSLVQLKEKERPAQPFPPLFTLPQSSTPGHLYNGQTFLRQRHAKVAPLNVLLRLRRVTRSLRNLWEIRGAKRKFYTSR